MLQTASPWNESQYFQEKIVATNVGERFRRTFSSTPQCRQSLIDEKAIEEQEGVRA